MFTEEVCDKLGAYVYRLVDPRNGETFYVGKGRRNRLFDHVDDARKHLDVLSSDGLNDEVEDALSAKFERIRKIQHAGLEVIHVVHRHDLDDKSAFEVEAALIDAYPGLSNDQSGHGSGSKGSMSPQELSAKYSLEEFPSVPGEKLILININRLDEAVEPDAIYQQVRLAWRLSPKRANRAHYVLAVRRGVVLGAFAVDPTGWLEATPENFPTLQEAQSGRYGFNGHRAAPAVWERFVGQHGKRITDDPLKHVQNPVLYNYQ